MGMIEDTLEPVVESMAVCRLLRVKKVGATYLVEQNKFHRYIGADGAEKVEDSWQVVAVAKPDFAREGRTARHEAYDFMHNANREIIETWKRDMRRAASTNGAPARRTDQGNQPAG
jgi:hypothetical protein